MTIRRYGRYGFLLALSILFICLFPIKAYAATLQWPVPGHTSWSSQGVHDNNAIDIVDSTIGGANVYAALGGTVEKVFLCTQQHYGSDGDCYGFGTGLVIRGSDGRAYQYAHMQANSIPENLRVVGVNVSTGQLIGRVGTTGNSSGNHLHFGICYGNYWEGIGDPTSETYSYSSPSVEGSEMGSGYSRQLADGDYIIACAGDINYQLDIAGDVVPAATYANIKVWPRYNPEREQDVFTVRYDNGFYSIKQKNTNMSLDVWDGRQTVGENIQMFPNNDSSAQRWALSRATINGMGQAGYRIQSKRSGWTVVPEGSVISQGRNVIQSYYTNGVGDGWSFIPYMPDQPIAEGKYILVSSVNNAYELDVSGDTGNIAVNTNVQIWNDEGNEFYERSLSKYNSFRFVALDNGYYKLVHDASGMALDVSDGTTTNAQNIAVHWDNGADAQQWAITRQGDGYMLRARCSGLALDLADGIATNGQNVWQVYYNGSKAQTWKIVPAEYKVRYMGNGGSGIPSDQIKYYKGKLVLSKNIPTRRGYTFTGWNTSADGTGASYKPGDVYNIDKDILLYAQWNPLTKYLLPDDLQTIGEEAFFGVSIESVDVPEGCISIEARAFANCNSLKDIYIPSSVNNIAEDAFEGSDGLTIYSPANSEAIKLAQKNGIAYVIVHE